MARIELFSGPNCAFCAQAKALLAAKGLAYEELDISDDAHRAEFARRLPRSKALPQIFIDGEHIGSLEDLRLLNQSGELAALASGAKPA